MTEPKKRNKQRIPRIELLRNQGDTGNVAVIGTPRALEMYYYDNLPEHIRAELQQSAMQINAKGIYEEVYKLTDDGLRHQLKQFKQSLVDEHERIIQEATSK